MILNTLSDYFAAQRDDLILSIQVKRQGARPIFNIQLVKPVDVAEAKKKSNEKTMVPALSLYDEWNKKEVAGSKPKARHICHRRRNVILFKYCSTHCSDDIIALCKKTFVNYFGQFFQYFCMFSERFFGNRFLYSFIV